MRVATLLSSCLTFWLITAHSIDGAPATKVPDYYAIAIPKVIIASTEHKIAVEFGSQDAALRVDSRNTYSNATAQGKLSLIRNGVGSYAYRIPFPKYRQKNIALTFTVFACTATADECTMKPGSAILTRTLALPVLQNEVLVFIEASKPIYKPGEKIKFRLLPIYPDSLSPSIQRLGKKQSLQFDLVYLEAPNKMRMAQWRNVDWLKALKGMSFDLLADPLFGKWKIVAKIGGVKDEETFTVKKYVLPRFTVSMKPPSYVFVKADRVRFEVCPQYSTGLPMKANVTAQLCMKRKGKSRSYYRKKRPCIPVSGKTDGISRCLAFNVSTKPLQLMNSSYHTWSVFAFVNASVSELGTKETVNKSAYGGQLVTSPFKIINKSPKIFRRGLPYYGRIQIVNLDDSPKFNVTIIASVQQWWSGWGFKKEYKSDVEGIIDFHIPPFPAKDDSSVSIMFTPKDWKQERYRRGFVSVNMPRLSFSVKNMHSPSNTFIQIYPLSRQKPQSPCATGNIKIRLQSNVPLQDRTIRVLTSARGNIGSIQTIGPTKKPEDACRDSNNSETGHFTCVSASGGMAKIRCLDGWSGTNCLTPLCPQGCLRGVCMNPGVCTCKQGWSGPSCNKCVPRKGCVNGCCSYGNDCYCYKGYTSYLCDRNVTRSRSKYIYRPPRCYDVVPLNLSEPYNPDKLEELRIFSRDVTIKIQQCLYPSARLTIWFMHEGPNQTEFVSIGLSLPDTKECMSKTNPTTFIFNNGTVRPGQKTTATIKTSGNNPKCALAISDVALDTFGTRGGVSQSQLSNDLNDLVRKLSNWYSNDPYRDLDNERCRPSPRGRRQKRSVMPYLPQSADSSTAFKDAGIFVLSNVQILTASCSGGLPILYEAVPLARNEVGVAGVPGAPVPVKRYKNIKKKALKARVRSFFPETWRFELIETSSTNYPLTAPDSMTTWKANMYCVSSSGLGISKPSRLTVFQPFFVQMVLPYSLIRGETAKVPVKVFSYLRACTEIVLTMKASTQLQTNGPQTVTSCLCNFDQITAYFRVKPTSLGRLPVEVHAESRPSARCSGTDAKIAKTKPVADAVRRQLLVEPEGIPEQITVGDLLCPSGKKAFASLALKTPSDKLNIVNDSQRAYVTWSGNVIGSSMENLDKMVKMPYGCGEQNMMSMVPSIYVLDYFNKSGVSKPNVMEKARKFIGIGYQRQLNYRLDDGSYSAFGKRDKNGSTWLTAFVFKSFVAASRYSAIDRSVLTSALDFLLSKAGPDGCFREDGRVFSSSLKGGVGRGADRVSITAYILSALVEARSIDPSLTNDTKVGIDAALQCLTIKTNATKDLTTLSTYAVALRTYALTKHDPTANITALYRAEVQRRVTKKDGFVYWPAEQTSKKSIYSRPWVRYTSADVETTAYVLLTELQEKALSSSRLVQLLPTVRWLTGQRNERGGWYSTQDTVIGLQALSSLATRISSGGKGTSLKLSVQVEEKKRSVTIGKDNMLVVSKMAVTVPNSLSVEATGAGCVAVQASVLFNVLDIGRPGAPFTLTATASQAPGDCGRSRVTVCARYTGGSAQSNMAVIKARMASGWEVPAAELDALTASVKEGDLKRIEVDPDKSLVLYFDYFSATNSCVAFGVEQAVEVKDVQPMLVQVYDYYRPHEVQERSVAVLTKACASPGGLDGAGAGSGAGCPLCTGDNSTAEAVVARLCGDKVHYYAGAEQRPGQDSAWRITQKVGDMILTWNGALKLPSGCECALGRRAIVAVHTQWWRLAMDEDVPLGRRWTVINVDTLSAEGRMALAKSCASKSDAFSFVFRMLGGEKDKKKKKKKNDEGKGQ